MRSFGNTTRTRADKAAAMAAQLIMARPDRIAALVAGHTAESFAKQHGLNTRDIRDTFERAKQRAGG